jgi:hypothetical protein
MRRAGALLLAALLLSGCHRYVPAELGELRPDMAVRVRVADRPTSPPLEGPVVELGPGGSGVTILPEASILGEEGPVSLTPVQIEVLERRELDRTRTALVVAGTAIVGLASILLIEGEPTQEPQRPGGGLLFFRLPVGGP